MIIISDHAIDRYIERVEPCTRDRAREIIQQAERGIEAACAMGAHIVRLDSGAKLRISGNRVVTVTMGGGRASGHFREG